MLLYMPLRPEGGCFNCSQGSACRVTVDLEKHMLRWEDWLSKMSFLVITGKLGVQG